MHSARAQTSTAVCGVQLCNQQASSPPQIFIEILGNVFYFFYKCLINGGKSLVYFDFQNENFLYSHLHCVNA